MEVESKSSLYWKCQVAEKFAEEAYRKSVGVQTVAVAAFAAAVAFAAFAVVPFVVVVVAAFVVVVEEGHWSPWEETETSLQSFALTVASWILLEIRVDHHRSFAEHSTPRTQQRQRRSQR